MTRRSWLRANAIPRSGRGDSDDDDSDDDDEDDEDEKEEEEEDDKFAVLENEENAFLRVTDATEGARDRSP